MDKEDLLKVFFEGEDYWLDVSGNTVAEEIIRGVVSRLSKELSDDEKKTLGKKLPKDIFSQTSGDSDKEYEKMLRNAGFKQCTYQFHDFGIPTAREIILSLVETAKEPELESWEKQRVDILNRAVQVFIDSAKSDIIDRYTQFLKSPADKGASYGDYGKNYGDDSPSSWGFSFDTGNIGRLSAWYVISRLQDEQVPPLAIKETGSIKLKGGRRIELHGFTKLFPENIFLQKKMLRGDFLNALFTWAHEFAHNISGEDDFTAGFTDAERYLHELLLITSFNNGELKKLQEEWDKIKENELKAKSGNPE